MFAAMQSARRGVKPVGSAAIAEPGACSAVVPPSGGNAGQPPVPPVPPPVEPAATPPPADPLADLRTARGWIDRLAERELWAILVRVRWPQGPQCPRYSDRLPVLGLLCQGGQVRLCVLKNVQTDTIRPIIGQLVARGARVYTDSCAIYHFLERDGYRHQTVSHRSGEYALDLDGDGQCEIHGIIPIFW